MSKINVCFSGVWINSFIPQGVQGPRGITGLPGPKGDAVSVLSTSGTDINHHVQICCLQTAYLSHQGLPGVDGREGIPGMPGAKVELHFDIFIRV